MSSDALPPDPEPARCDKEAEDRAKQFKQLDPFPHIKPALLSAADIEDYARVTSMLFPFCPNPASLKPASYEVRPGRKFIRWDENGQRIEVDLTQEDSFDLLPNSISFIQIEPKIRLPDYIAIRFNLRIAHVHRGLLLGTGPLIDPGFSGVPLIPLHNLTSETYSIQCSEGLIWVEFTKTAPEIVKPADPPYRRRGSFQPLEPEKTNQDVNYYFYKANRLQPIRSSISEAIRDSAANAQKAEKSAEQAADSATTAVRSAAQASGRLFRISIGGAVAVSIAAFGILIALVIGLHAYFGQIEANVETTQSLAASIRTEADKARSNAARAIRDEQALRQDLDGAKAQIDSLRGQLARLARQLGSVQQPSRARSPGGR